MAITEVVANPYRVEEDALRASKISLTAYHEDLSLRDAALKLGFLTGDQFDAWVRPEEMTHPLGESQ
jgi:fumarate hydratase class II